MQYSFPPQHRLILPADQPTLRADSFSYAARRRAVNRHAVPDVGYFRPVTTVVCCLDVSLSLSVDLCFLTSSFALCPNLTLSLTSSSIP